MPATAALRIRTYSNIKHTPNVSLLYVQIYVIVFERQCILLVYVCPYPLMYVVIMYVLIMYCCYYERRPVKTGY